MGDYYVILGSEIAIGTKSALTKLYPSTTQYDLPSDYYDRKYVVSGGTLVIDESAEKEEKIQSLTEEYASEKTRLCEEYTTATMQGDTDTAESVVEDLTALDEWYDEEYAKIEGGEE